MKINHKRIGLVSLSVLSIALSIGVVFSGKKEAVVTSGYTSGDAATYYNGISSTATEGELLSSLQALNTRKRQDLVGYNNMPNKYTQTDPGTSSGQVTSFYSGTSAKYSGNMNREHTWPASRTIGGRGNDPLEDDIHMTRPTLISDNSSRGNSFYTYTTERGWDPASLGVESYRGDAARIIFYCIVADSRLGLVDRDIDSSANHTMGKLSTLLEWNLKYPVLNRENIRNEAAEKLQGNRNPFIDHPEYACKIWGNTNANTRAVCGYTPTPPDPEPAELTGLSLDISEAHLEIGESLTLTVSPVPSDAKLPDLYWWSDNDKVATVNNGVVTAIKDGTTNINVCTLNGAYKVSCKIIVGSGVNPSSSSSKNGCGGNIVTTSVLLSTISILGVGLLIINKYRRKKNENE